MKLSSFPKKFITFGISLAISLTTIQAWSNTQSTNYRSVGEILQQSPKDTWYMLNQDNLIYITLNNGALVVMELNDTFAPKHAEQIRLLAKQAYWDNLPVYRVQDNYVVQFGGLDYETDTMIKPLPDTIKKLPAEFTIAENSIKITTLKDKEPYSDKVGFVDGFAVAVKDKQAFLVQCYGVVGSARDNAPDSSQGSELYVIIGQPARHIDRQITVVGRVVHGMEHLSTLTRGAGSMGFFEKGQDFPATIKSIRLGSQLPSHEQLQFEALRTDSQTFADVIDARRHLQGEWFAAAVSGGMGICDTRQTVRLLK